jgi:hypothetical protein
VHCIAQGMVLVWKGKGVLESPMYIRDVYRSCGYILVNSPRDPGR